MKRVVVIADMHCGHRVGLTPPDYQEGIRTLRSKNDHKTKFLNRCAKTQKECWDAYAVIVANLQPVHLLIVNGDAIDGRGERSGGSEIIDATQDEQCEMAAQCILLPEAKHIVMTYGTPYHTGKDEDFEDIIAKRVKADSLGSHEWPSVNGVVFDCKHKIGGSSIPHGRYTALAREILWGHEWARDGLQPYANVTVRSHVHYLGFCGCVGEIGFTTPALQAMGTKYGSRQCSGKVNWGVSYLDVEDDGTFDYFFEMPKLKCQVAKEDKY